MDRIFKRPFSMTGVIFQDRERCQLAFCFTIKNPLLCRSARPGSSREARERSLFAPLARTQSERRRRLALASGFRLVRSFGIDRIAAPARAVGCTSEEIPRDTRHDVKDDLNGCSKSIAGSRSRGCLGHHPKGNLKLRRKSARRPIPEPRTATFRNLIAPRLRG